MALNNEHIKWFRDSSPYIDAHRDRTFVICLTGDALRSENLKNIVSDCALLNSLGVRLVITAQADNRVLVEVVALLARDAVNPEEILPDLQILRFPCLEREVATLHE